jgi:hypothetical protein
MLLEGTIKILLSVLMIYFVPDMFRSTRAIVRVSGDFMSIFQDFIPEVIPSQKCHMNTSPIISGYGAVDRN